MDEMAVAKLLNHESISSVVELLAVKFRKELKGRDKEVAKFLRRISRDLGAKVERKIDWGNGMVVERFRELAD